MDKEAEIIKAIKEMGVFRTLYKPDEISRVVSKAIKTLEEPKTGITIPDNATNGDVIKLLFSKATYFNEDSSCATMKVNMGELDEYVDFYIDWWNAPYKREEK